MPSPETTPAGSFRTEKKDGESSISEKAATFCGLTPPSPLAWGAGYQAGMHGLPKTAVIPSDQAAHDAGYALGMLRRCLFAGRVQHVES